MLGRSHVFMNPAGVQQALARFDELSNFQAASLLMAVLLGMLATAICLLVGARLLVPAPPPSQTATVAPLQGPPPAPQVQRAAPARLRAVTVPPSVNLRAEPTTAAQSLAVLPQHTELELLGDDDGDHSASWRHVRTDDGREGWIIVTALD